MRALLWVLLWGCTGGTPATVDGCDGLGSLRAREDCRLELLGPVFDVGTEAEFEAALARLEDPVSRDLVRLRLAVSAPDRAGGLCHKVETEPAREKCRQVLGRPHLRGTRP